MRKMGPKKFILLVILFLIFFSAILPLQAKSQFLAYQIYIPLIIKDIVETPTPTTTLPPSPTPTLSTSPTQAPNCDPSYPTVCIPPPPPDLNCGDISYRNFTVLPPDPHNFDSDKDGIGCET